MLYELFGSALDFGPATSAIRRLQSSVLCSVLVAGTRMTQTVSKSSLDPPVNIGALRYEQDLQLHIAHSQSLLVVHTHP
jgi:hypothetical protein